MFYTILIEKNIKLGVMQTVLDYMEISAKTEKNLSVLINLIND